MADAVAGRLRAHHLVARTVTLKVRYGSFATHTHSATPPEPVDTGPGLARVARGLLDAIDHTQGVRLLGVSVSNLLEEPGRQLSLDDPTSGGWQQASLAIDDIRDRFGATAIGPASLVGPSGLRLTRKGQQQWGPDRQG